MELCRNLCQVEDIVSKNYIHDTLVVPHALASPLTDEDITFLQENNREFNKLYKDMVRIYDASYTAGLRIEPDSFDGFGLVNRTGSTIKIGVIEHTVGLLGKVPKTFESDDWSMMEGERLLVGVARWDNHSCQPNCEYYMSGGYNGRLSVQLRALEEIADGAELVTFYGPDFFGEKKADCLCGHDSLHGQNNNSQDQDSEKSDCSVAKKRRKVIPRIRMRKSIPAHLNSLIKFYDECSNTSIPSSENPESDVPSRSQLQSSDVETILLRDSDENSEKNSEPESKSNPSSENSAVEIYSSSSYSGLGDTIDMNIGDHFDKHPINQVSDVAPTNLVASLIALVSKHNASDSLLNDLLKRDQAIFGEGAVSPWFVQKQLNDLYSKFISRKLSVDRGEIILIKFPPQLIEIVLNSLSEMLSYSRNKNIAEDIFMPDLQIVDGKILIKLIVNIDGALVAKSPPSSAWPLFITVSDLPPRKRQAFQNIVLACLYVGHGHPDFDIFFNHIEQEFSETEHILFQGERLCVMLKPILFIADLTGKSKVLKMKRCNGFYGCTLCTQKGVHYGGVHRYPHDEEFVIRSYESHMSNLIELEKGSDDEIIPKSHRKAELELRTKGVQGKSKILTLIPNQPLSSPVDPMHQLFLVVTKDLLGHLYDKMLTNRKKDLNQFLSSMKLPCELKNSVRPLDSLSTFKAKELKVFLFYLAPVIFPHSCSVRIESVMKRNSSSLSLPLDFCMTTSSTKKNAIFF